eukprot:4425177-Prymnesium_polylepis.1
MWPSPQKPPAVLAIIEEERAQREPFSLPFFNPKRTHSSSSTSTVQHGIRRTRNGARLSPVTWPERATGVSAC